MGYPSGPGLSGVQAPQLNDWTQSPKPRMAGGKAISASEQIWTGPCTIVSFSYVETTGSAKVIAYLHNGTDANGVLLACLGSAASGSGGSDPGLPGIYADGGIYLEVVSGTLSLAVSVVPYVDQLPN